jgi:hypothetical protein
MRLQRVEPRLRLRAPISRSPAMMRRRMPSSATSATGQRMVSTVLVGLLGARVAHTSAFGGGYGPASAASGSKSVEPADRVAFHNHFAGLANFRIQN